MVAISAAVLSKGGKVLLSRQFVPISRTRVEGYLAAFPKLIPVDHQHTIIDTEQLRYLYQPLEQLYLVLLTNKQSNIMEDIDTLRTLAKLIPEYCLAISEEAVQAHVFELLFAFDEVIGSHGYKEVVTIAQVKTYTEMDSHEEKLQRIITESKINEAKQEMMRKAETIAKEREDRKRQMAAAGGSMGGGGGDGRHGRYSSMEGGMGSGGSGSMSGMGGGGGYEEDRDTQRQLEREREERERNRARAPSPAAPGGGGGGGKPSKGMQLGKSGQKTDNLLTQLSKEDAMGPPVRRPGAAAAAPASASSPAQAVGENVRVVVREKLVVELEKDGTVKRVEVKGEMKLRILDPDYSRIVIHTSGSHIEKADYKCSLHPKINKRAWADGQSLQLTDAAKGFPVGTDKELVIIKWRKMGGEADIPFTINFWPSAEGNSTSVNVEYSNVQHKQLTDVTVRIPCAGGEPDVSAVAGEYKFDQRGKSLTWRITDVSGEHSSGQLEFTAMTADTDSFYPIQVDFASEETLSGLVVSGVVQVEDEKEVEFVGDHRLEVEKYTIE